jgi:hypothetical protein
MNVLFSSLFFPFSSFFFSLSFLGLGCDFGQSNVDIHCGCVWFGLDCRATEVNKGRNFWEEIVGCNTGGVVIVG